MKNKRQVCLKSCLNSPLTKNRTPLPLLPFKTGQSLISFPDLLEQEKLGDFFWPPSYLERSLTCLPIEQSLKWFCKYCMYNPRPVFSCARPPIRRQTLLFYASGPPSNPQKCSAWTIKVEQSTKSPLSWCNIAVSAFNISLPQDLPFLFIRYRHICWEPIFHPPIQRADAIPRGRLLLYQCKYFSRSSVY